jgi:hypothetical protein
MLFTFYATFGSGQPGYPGYLQIDVDEQDEQAAMLEARRRVSEETGGRWCGMYRSMEQMHPDDRIFRGTA